MYVNFGSSVFAPRAYRDSLDNRRMVPRLKTGKEQVVRHLSTPTLFVSIQRTVYEEPLN